jgi:hypothetical protein
MTDQPQEPPRKERRRHPRSKVSIPIEFKPEGATVASRAETADLSLFGCYVEMSFTLAVGTKMDVILWVEDARLPTRALVVTNHPQFGNGIEFLDMSPEDQARLTQFLKACEEQAESRKQELPAK